MTSSISNIHPLVGDATEGAPALTPIQLPQSPSANIGTAERSLLVGRVSTEGSRRSFIFPEAVLPAQNY